MIAEKARELDTLREKRAKLRAELDAIEPTIRNLIHELTSELHEDHPRTEREDQVLALVRNGKSNKEIGAILNISERTVKYHVSALLEKACVRDRHNL
jgi:DNA-binding NarL/FixJ family response regulator